MLLSKTFSNCFISSESSEINFPTEVWIHIWSFLDFKTVQKICTLVSKEWLYKIRNSTRLSGEMILRLENRNVKDINDALSRWPKLKTLHLSDCDCNHHSCNCEGSRLSKLVSHWGKSKEFALNTKMFGVNLTDNKLLRKITVLKSMPLMKLGDWGKAVKVCFNPKNWTPANLKNVNTLKINLDKVQKNIQMMEIGQVLINVEELYITGKNGMLDAKFDSEFILSLQNFLFGFKKLKKVWIEVTVDITDFFKFLRAIANIKCVKVLLNVGIVHGHLEKKYVKGVFEEGFRIVENTFPIESTDVGISDVQYKFYIDKVYKKEPKLYQHYKNKKWESKNDN